MTCLATKNFNFETALDKCSMKKNNLGAQVKPRIEILWHLT